MPKAGKRLRVAFKKDLKDGNATTGAGRSSLSEDRMAISIRVLSRGRRFHSAQQVLSSKSARFHHSE
jgi:hypothetical protein